MPQKDFILREIEKIAILIQYLLGKYKPAKSLEEQQETEKLFNNEFMDRYGKDLEYFLNIEKQDFEKEFIKSEGFNFTNIELLADLIYMLGNNQYSNSQRYLNKALELYEYVDESSKTYSFERSQKINSIKLS